MKKRAVVAGIVMLFTVLSAFAALPATPAAAAQGQGTLYLAMQQDIPDFNTWNLASNSVWKSYVINWGFESLAGLDYNMLPYPLLAESWEFDEPNLTVTLHIRQNVNFHDGTPMTADDVVFIYHAAREGKTYSSNIINAFDIDQDGTVSQEEIEAGVQKVDDYTVRMVMPHPYGQFFSTTLGVPIMPKHIWEDHLTEDGLLDDLWNDPAATISTGPFRYKEGEDNTYRVMEKFDGYWGKEFETPAGYKLYPPNVDELYYKIYASIDTAILALQAGAVDHITWAITAGRVPSLQSDPNIKLVYLEDNGYFYLAFNQKFRPMNDLDFRKAVSHLIDKDQIVNVYMGGFGAKGNAAEPPYWGDWYNESVASYPYDDPFDDTTTVPEDILTAAGYADYNGDGWLDMPDGTPMEKITILTPPADYDPIRIRAGQMIAKNMREVGINAEAKALDFDTLVARLQSMDYKMLIIGWSLSSEPVGNVFDILGPKASSNTFGFWSEADPNPFYKDLMGVNTLADAETQALAVKVDELAELARGSFDVADQIFYTRWGQGVIADAIPVNVLYYRVNIQAYRTTWEGWLPFLGELFGPGTNIYSLSNLVRTGTGGPSGGATASVNAGLSMPGKVALGGEVAGYVVAIDADGEPVSGATVSLTVEGVAGADPSVSVDPESGTTNAQGVFEFTLTGESLAYSYVNVTVTSGGVTAEDGAVISVVEEFPRTLFMTVTPEVSILRPGESTTVALTVTDAYGDPVEGATLSVDPNLVSYGEVTPLNVTTDADGYAEATYTAPATILDKNAHLTLTLSYAVSKEGYTWPNSAAANMLIYNEDPRDWTMVTIESVTDGALDSASNSTTITVLVTDDDGNPVENYNVTVGYSNLDMVADPVTEWVWTDATGHADIPVTIKDLAASGALKIWMKNVSALNTVPADIVLTYEGTTPPADPIYGGYMTFNAISPVLDPVGDLEVTAHVWDHTGAPADGVPAALLVPGTTYGSLVWCDDIIWDSTWDGWGINIVTSADEQNIVTSGPFNTPYDYDDWYGNYNDGWIYWDDYAYMGGVTITGGEFTFVLYAQNWAPLDLMSTLYLVPDAIGTFDNATSYNYMIHAQTVLSGGYVIGKAMEVVVPTYEMNNGVMVAKVSGFDSTFVDVTVVNQDGDPVEGAAVEVYQNSLTGNALYVVIPSSANRRWTTPVMTDADGYAQATIVAVARVEPVVTSASIKADVYVKASTYGALSMFSQTQIIIFTQQSFVTIEPLQDVVAIGDKMTVAVTVTDINGAPVPYMPVELTVGAGEVTNPIQSTNVDGVAVFALDTSSISGAKAAFIPMQAKAGGPGWEVSLAKATVAAQNTGPVVTLTFPADDAEDVDGSNLTLAGNVYDANGIQSVRLVIDDEPAVSLTGTAGAVSWEISRLLGELEEGEHTVTINATDALGVSTEKTITFTTILPEEAGGADMLAWGVAAAGWIVAAIALVLMLMKPKKGPKAMAPAEAEVEKEEKE